MVVTKGEKLVQRQDSPRHALAEKTSGLEKRVDELQQHEYPYCVKSVFGNSDQSAFLKTLIFFYLK
jgi:hypothetical protein